MTKKKQKQRSGSIGEAVDGKKKKFNLILAIRPTTQTIIFSRSCCVATIGSKDSEK